jgi:hypothetical protein
MKLSATLKSGVICFSDGAEEVSGLFLVSELQENSPTRNDVRIKYLIFLEVVLVYCCQVRKFHRNYAVLIFDVLTNRRYLASI